MEVEVKKALVLDLDRTIRYSKSGTPFIKGPKDVAIYSDVEPILRRYRDEGWLIFGLTNQGGVAFGHKTVEDDKAEIRRTTNLFTINPFTQIFSAYHHPGGDVHPYNYRSLLRKPSIGMLALCELSAGFNKCVIDWDNSIFVGDRKEDQECAANAGIEFRWAKEFFGRNDE